MVAADDAVEATPLVDISMTGEAAWITTDGLVGWTGDDSSVQLGDDPAYADEPSWRTRLFSLGSGALLAVWRHGTTFLSPPGATSLGDDWTALDNGWQYRDFKANGLPDTDQADPAYPGCPPGERVALRYDEFGSGRGYLVDASDSVSFDAFVGFGPDCSVIDAGSGLRLLTRSGEGGALPILPEYTGQDVLVSYYQVNFRETAVLLAPGAATQVVQVDSAQLPGPWGLSSSDEGALAGFGRRRHRRLRRPLAYPPVAL